MQEPAFSNIVRNFPTHYTFFKRVYANVIHLLGDLKVVPVSRQLTKLDKKRFKRALKPGDIVLSGGLRMLSSLFVQGAVTHALIYAGQNHFYHVNAHGVERTRIKPLLRMADTLMIVRHPELNPKKLKLLKAFLKSKLGTPYNFDFERCDDSYICSDLIQDAFDHCGLSIKTPPPSSYVFHTVTHPSDYARSRPLTMEFKSHNLRVDEGRVILVS